MRLTYGRVGDPTICARMAENTVVGGDGLETLLTDSLRLIV
jgi:hypothetical protein